MQSRLDQARRISPSVARFRHVVFPFQAFDRAPSNFPLTITKEKPMLLKLYRCCSAGLAAVALSLLVVPAAQAQSEQQVLIGKAETTLSNFVRDPDMTWIQKNLP